LSDSELDAAELPPARPAAEHRYPMRDIAQVRRSLALADHDRRRGEIGELVYWQLRSKLNARLAELALGAGAAGRLSIKEEPRELRGQFAAEHDGVAQLTRRRASSSKLRT